MKILLTTDTYLPMINGVVTSTINLYRELKRMGHDARIMTLSHTEDEWIDGDVYYLKSVRIGIYPDARVKLPFKNKLIKKIISWKPDIIHSQTEFSTMVTAKYISGKLNIPQVHTYHTMYEDYVDYIPGAERLKKSAVINLTRLLLNSFDGVIAPTLKTEKALISYGVNKDIYIIPTGINLDRFQRDFTLDERKEMRLRFGIDENDKVMVYVGRVAEEKNIFEIVDLFPEIEKSIESVKFLIVGGGPYLKILKEHIKQNGLSKQVIFTGMVKPDETYKYYKIGDVFVTASRSETQGLTYLEALSSGCPVVCRFDKCIEGVIKNGRNGFAYKDSEEFSEYITDILLNNNFRRNLSEEAARNAHMYSSEEFAHNVLNVYSKVLCKGKVQLAV